MNLYTHLDHRQLMSASLDSHASARRREQLLWHKLEANELRKRRRRELAQRARTMLSARRWRDSRELPDRIEALDLQEQVR
jgi:hypothetical protein